MVLFDCQRCQPWVHKNAECTLCLDSCPVEGCLGRDDGRITVDGELCTNCGICTTACPSGALALESLDDRELLRRLAEVSAGKPLALECALGPNAKNQGRRKQWAPETNTARVPCLAVLKESHLVSLILSNSINIDLDCSGCESCSYKTAPDIIRMVVRYADNLLCASGSTGMINVRTGAAPEAVGGGRPARRSRGGGVREIEAVPEYSRRELFFFLGDKAKAKAAENLLGKKPDREQHPPGRDGVVPERREILLEALDGCADSSIVLADGEFPVRSLTLDGCVVCRRCESFCPTGALTRVGREGETTIDFDLSLCVSCNQCRELCPEGAISYDATIDIGLLTQRAPVTLVSTPRVSCERCGKDYHPEVDRNGCTTCNRRDRLDGAIQSILFGHGKDGKEHGPSSKEAL